MNSIKLTIKNLFTNNSLFRKQTTILLGRWNIDYCAKKIDRKIELVNEDHCGSCIKMIHK